MTDNTARPIAPSGFQPNLATRRLDGPQGGDAAEYITPERSGLEAGFYVTDRGLPWHVTLARRLNTPELMAGSATKLRGPEALELAGLAFTVAMAPLFAQIGRKRVPVPDRFATYRTDTGAVLGSGMSGKYQLVQPAQLAAFGEALVDAGGPTYETGGSLFGGRQNFLSMEIPDEIHVAGDPSEYRLYLLLSNGHDGNHPFRADVTVERGVCRNTVRIAQKGAISSFVLKHTSQMDGRLQQAREALGLSFAYAESFAATASQLASTSLADRQVDEILDRLFPLTETQQERVDKDPVKLASLPRGMVELIYQESPSVAPIRGSAYGLLNAVTEYADHFASFRAGDGGEAEDVKAERLIFGTGASAISTVKQRAWDLLTADIS